MTQDEDDFWTLATAYIADAAGLLGEKARVALDSIESENGDPTWREEMEESLDFSQAFIRAVYDLVTGPRGGHKSDNHFLLFMLYGLGCPDPGQVIRGLRNQQ